MSPSGPPARVWRLSSEEADQGGVVKKLRSLLAVGAVGGLLEYPLPSAAAPRPTLEVDDAEAKPPRVDEAEPGLGPRDRLLFRDPLLDAAAHMKTPVTYATIGGTGAFAGARGQVVDGAPKGAGRPASHLTSELAG
jgi:hypothetical protein